jgi:RimJ/RimL family protein N-acetyltransferase
MPPSFSARMSDLNSHPLTRPIVRDPIVRPSSENSVRQELPREPQIKREPSTGGACWHEVAITTCMAPDLLTSRLRLRKWIKDDLTPFAVMNADLHVMEYFPSTLTRAESDAFAERICAQLDHHAYGLWAVEIVQQARFIGFVGLVEPNFKVCFTPCVEIGWRLDKNYWGQGYALEAAQRVMKYAFEDLCLSDLVSFTAATNLRSQKLMQKLGFSSKPSDNFEHPSLAQGHSLRNHVLYRLKKADWSCTSDV